MRVLGYRIVTGSVNGRGGGREAGEMPRRARSSWPAARARAARSGPSPAAQPPPRRERTAQPERSRGASGPRYLDKRGDAGVERRDVVDGLGGREAEARGRSRAEEVAGAREEAVADDLVRECKAVERESEYARSPIAITGRHGNACGCGDRATWRAALSECTMLAMAMVAFSRQSATNGRSDSCGDESMRATTTST